MKKTFLIIMVILLVNVVLYGVFAFATWELNPKYWDAFLRGMFSTLFIVVSIFCGVGAYCEIRN